MIPAFARLRISPIIGFILIGVLVGPFGLGAMAGQYPWLNYVTISNRAAIEPFAEFGIILLLFAWSPFLVRAVKIYLSSRIQMVAAILAATPQTFREFLDHVSADDFGPGDSSGSS